MQMGGGVLVAIGLLGGAATGVAFGEGSIGMVAGLVLGLVAALLVGWWDARRRRP